MGDKKSPTRPKRQSKPADDGYWDCSVCTFKNSAEAFKCLMCDVRKGTSTRQSQNRTFLPFFALH
uniref:YY1 associated factor 2 n=1 Tax=Takifugu rubripes TaxID=31033 RepID=A0A674MIY9_TAKRU